jgi:hypothetical protein
MSLTFFKIKIISTEFIKCRKINETAPSTGEKSPPQKENPIKKSPENKDKN